MKNNILLNEMRLGQQAAYSTIMERLAKGKKRTAIVLPTRYGKSDLMRNVSVSSDSEGISSTSIVLSPSSILRNQMVRPDKLNAFVLRYGIDPMMIRRFTIWESLKQMPFSSSPLMISSTIQMMTTNVDVVKEACKYASNINGGLPVVFHIDECHTVSDEKARGKLVDALDEIGAMTVLYTATPVRADGELIPGFKFEELDLRERYRYEISDQETGDDDPEKVRIRQWECSQHLVKLLAHHETTLKDAWDENPSPICRLTRQTIDVDLSTFSGTGGEDKLMLSEASKSAARGALGRSIRDPEVIAKGASLLVDQLTLTKQLHRDAGAIVFTGNDDVKTDGDDGSNKHARLVKQAIEQAGRVKNQNITCTIVTMKNETGDSGVQEIEDFCAGKGDVLIVKQMGGAGLDAGRIKIILDLSPVRTVASVIQRVMRVATPWEGITVGTVITLADPIMNSLWENFISGDGGEAPENWRTIRENLVDEYERDVSDESETIQMVINGAGMAAYDDSNGLEGNMSMWKEVEEAKRKYPPIMTCMTDPEIADLLNISKGVQASSQSTNSIAVEPMHIEGAKLKKEANDVVRKLMNGTPYDPKNKPIKDAYTRRLQTIWRKAKTKAGIKKRTTLESITDCGELRNLVSALREMDSE